MWSYNHNNELYHYGKKGMKWGVRKNSRHQTVNSESKSARKQDNKSFNNANKQPRHTNKEKAIAIGVGATLGVLALYGSKKLNGNIGITPAITTAGKESAMTSIKKLSKAFDNAKVYDRQVDKSYFDDGTIKTVIKNNGAKYIHTKNPVTGARDLRRYK